MHKHYERTACHDVAVADNIHRYRHDCVSWGSVDRDVEVVSWQKPLVRDMKTRPVG